MRAHPDTDPRLDQQALDVATATATDAATEAAIEALAPFYDLDMGHVEADLDLYRHIARRSGGRVLDLGAGTGRVAAALAADGVEVVALERSAAMRTAGASRCKAAGVRVLDADLRNFHLDEPFDLIICALSTFQHLLTRADQLAALGCMRRHLAPDGLVVIDIAVPAAAALEPQGSPAILEWVRRNPADGRVVTKWASSQGDPAAQMQWLTFLYDVQDAHGVVRRTVAQFPLRHLFRGEMEGLLERTGLRPVQMYGSYDLDPPEAGERLIVVVEAVGEVKEAGSPA